MAEIFSVREHYVVVVSDPGDPRYPLARVERHADAINRSCFGSPHAVACTVDIEPNARRWGLEARATVSPFEDRNRPPVPTHIASHGREKVDGARGWQAEHGWPLPKGEFLGRRPSIRNICHASPPPE